MDSMVVLELTQVPTHAVVSCVMQAVVAAAQAKQVPMAYQAATQLGLVAEMVETAL